MLSLAARRLRDAPPDVPALPNYKAGDVWARAGGGIHWGPALHDAWTQLFLHAMCGGGSGTAYSAYQCLLV